MENEICSHILTGVFNKCSYKLQWWDCGPYQGGFCWTSAKEWIWSSWRREIVYASGLFSVSLQYTPCKLVLYFPTFIHTSQNSMASCFLCPHHLHIPVSLTAPSGPFSTTSRPFTGLLLYLPLKLSRKQCVLWLFSEAMQKLLFRHPPTLVLIGQLLLLNPFRAKKNTRGWLPFHH